MAPRDHTTDADTHDGGSDDWFEDPDVAESGSTTGPSETSPGRRLTVLTEQKEPATSDTDDDWFIDDRGGDPASASATESDSAPDSTAPHDSDHYESFDARTTVLRNQRPHSAPPPAAQSWWRRHRGAAAVTAALAVLGGSALGVGVLLTGFSDEPAAPTAMSLDEIVSTTAAPTSTAPAAAGAAAADVTWCTGQGDGKPVTEDSDDPGAAAIWRFEKAFYYDRDGAAARAAGTPDAVMASAQRLQVGIDQLEPDIEFCVLADPVDAGIYDVTVLERGPGIDGRMSRQRITTTGQPGGTTLISAIVSR